MFCSLLVLLYLTLHSLAMEFKIVHGINLVVYHFPYGSFIGFFHSCLEQNSLNSFVIHFCYLSGSMVIDIYFLIFLAPPFLLQIQYYHSEFPALDDIFNSQFHFSSSFL